jgi:hypothetical protein
VSDHPWKPGPTTLSDTKRFSDICVLDETPQAEAPDVPAEFELLLCCARTSIHSRALERLRTLVGRDLDWQRLIRLAGSHGVLPLLYRSLSRNSSDAVPKGVLDQLRDAFRLNVQHGLSLTAELLRLLDFFAGHGINAIPFKGPVLAASVYKDLSLRQFSDLDVLVNRDDIVKAGGLLASQGYQPITDDGVASEQNLDPDDVAYFEPSLYTFVHRDRGTRVDLQWRVAAEKHFSFSLEENPGRDRLVPVTVAGRSVLTFAPMDLLLLLCVHGAKHQWLEMKWICDVAELVRTEKETIDWRELHQEASRQGVRRMLSLGLFLARDLLGAELPVEMSRAVDRDLRGKSIISTVVSKLFTESMETSRDLEKVVFYLRTKDRWQDRIRFCSCYISQYLHRVVTPTSKDRNILCLPAPLFFLYYFFRPLRLTVKYLRLALRSLSRGKQ